MEESAYICVNCKKRVMREEFEDTMAYVVMDEHELYEATCSEECAETVKQRNIERVTRALDRVKNTKIEKMAL